MGTTSLILFMALCSPVFVNFIFGQLDGVSSNCTATIAGSAAPQKSYHGPVALGPLSINNRAGGIVAEKLFSMLTPPAAPPGPYVCYHDAAIGSYLVVERGADDPRLIRGLTVSRINVCPGRKINQASGFANWATERGIRLGSTAKDVLSKYGEVSSVWDVHTDRGFSPYPREGDRSRMTSRERILVYLPEEGAADTNHAFFGIRNGVVVWITLSDNE